MSSSTSESNLLTAKTVLSAVASVAAASMVARSVAHDFLPDELRDYFFTSIKSFFIRFSSEMTMVIDEFNGMEDNEIYDAAGVYLGTKISPSNRHVKVSKPESEKSIQLKVEKNEEIVDYFKGIKFSWLFVCQRIEHARHFYNHRDMSATLKSEVRLYTLSFHKKYKDMVVEEYLPWILDQAKIMKAQKKTIKIYTLDPEDTSRWEGINLNHPSTFETLAMDGNLKSMIENDLRRFLGRKEYYKRVGKAWKRGYLLYGPPGTGKSSLIAAMANYLNFDIYDLDLTALKSNSELRALLLNTANRSILVVEDIDCSIEFKNREDGSNADDDADHESGKRKQDKQITLSGLLNFIDGLWSSCGDERIIIFTTNHKVKLDPALLRPGRMDMHIHMSYITPSAFRVLAWNYLRIRDHQLFKEIEELVGCIDVTPAEIAEQMMKEDDPDLVLQGLVECLERKKVEIEHEESKGKQKDEAKGMHDANEVEDEILLRSPSTDSIQV